MSHPQRWHICCREVVSAKMAHPQRCRLRKGSTSAKRASLQRWHLRKDSIFANTDLHSIGTIMGLLAGEPWEEETFHFHYHVNTIKLTHFNLGGMGEIEANNTSEK
jgi:hypothetical protein